MKRGEFLNLYTHNIHFSFDKRRLQFLSSLSIKVALGSNLAIVDLVHVALSRVNSHHRRQKAQIAKNSCIDCVDVFEKGVSYVASVN